MLDNFGLTPSFTTRAYVDNGTVTDGDGEILVALKPDHGPTAAYVARLREELPQRFPDCTFYFQPADITSQILDFGLPAPIDVQVVGVRREENLAAAKRLCRSWPGFRASPTSTSTKSRIMPRSASTWTASWRRSWASRSRA